MTDDPPGPRDEAPCFRDPAFRDPARPFRARADDLLGRLTAEERIAMLHQRSPAVPRLGAAEFHTGTEGVHGAAWRDHHGTGKTLPATVFPQPVGIAATWDPELGRRIGRATGREIRALHERHPLISLNVWAPVVNPLRDPRWGRNEEGYSEDPLLTAVMGTAFCRGLSGRPGADEDTGGNGYLLTAPTLKHFLGYNNEDDRDLTSSGLRPRVLREYDLPPFRAPIEAGAATGVMPAYNLVNGCPAHVSPLLAEIRTWTDEELLTCSDAWAPSNLVRTQHYFDDHPQAHAAALKAGLDSFTDQDADGEFTAAAVTEALKRGLITMDDVDRAVRRKLLVRLRLGEFDPDGGPFAGAAAMDTPAHRDLAREAARGAVVLLKNDGLLPLVPQAQPRIAVVGPLAATLYEDWYSPALPYQVTIADGLAAAWGAALGDSAALNGGAARSDSAGAAVTVNEAAERVRTDLGEFDVFDWGGDVVTLRDAGTGKYLTLADAGELAVTADKPDGWTVRETFQRQPLPGGNMLLRSTASGQAVRLRWDVLADGVAQAAEQARAADVAIVVVGNDPMIGGREARDRTTLNLPPSMDRLIRAVTAANPRTVVVIMSSYPYVVPEAPNAIVWSCHAGQETGTALADILTGRHAPGGRLPQTWYAADADLPAALDYDIIAAGWTYQYMRTTPRYPFGHGLTYTTFRYGELTVTAAGNTVTAALDVTNTGDRPATETVQLYARYPAPDQPRRRLCGFTRLALAPGETATAVIEVPDDRLALWDVATGRLSVPAGTIEIGAGASSADIRQTAALEIPGPPRGHAVPVIRGQVSAADFDDYANIALAEGERGGRTVITTSVRQERGWLLFRDFYPARTRDAVFRLAASAPGGGRVEVWLSEPGDSVPGSGRGPVASAAVPCTGGRYAWTEVRVPCDLPDGPVDLYVALSGAVWLDWFRPVIWFGGDYNPEQWDAAVWAEDDALMRRARVNTATVGVFSWAMLEPSEGRFSFDWLDATLDRLHANGVRVILATPTASPPPWFTLAHPDAMPVRADGSRLWHGSRDTYCAAAPAYREAALRITGELARRYAGHPALALWHVHNEYGTLCWCDHAAAAFRRWLQSRYGAGADGLAGLNEAWGTAFWSQRYSAWEQVMPPRATQYRPNPGQSLDFRRFWSAELLSAFVAQRDLLRSRTPGVPVTTNFMGPEGLVLDPWEWGREVDVVAVDHYLADTGAAAGHADIAFVADWARGIGGGRPWLLMEQAPGTVTGRDGGQEHRAPGRMLRDSLGYVARGSDSALFFQWRASRSGAELYHPALVPHAGADTRIFREAVSLGAALERLSEVAGSVTAAAGAALIVDAESRWALETRGLPSPHVRHLDVARALHGALWRSGIACDVAAADGDLAGYRLVVVPAVYLLSADGAASLRRYVAGGGHVVVTFCSGIADSAHQVYTGGYPGALRDVLGIRVEEFHPLPPGVTAPLTAADGAAPGSAPGSGELRLTGAVGSLWTELLHTDGAAVLARYAAGALAGLPAVTRHRFGAGTAWYVSTLLANEPLEQLLRAAAAAAGLDGAGTADPPGAAVSRRTDGNGRSWLFAFNHGDAVVRLPAAGVDLLSGREVTGTLALAAGDVAVVREPR